MDVALLRGEAEGWSDQQRSPFRNAPLAIYALDGWAYLSDDGLSSLDDLVCTYADGSKVKYPLPDKKLRGLGRCDYVMAWDDGDITSDEFVKFWPFGLDRRPMAVCTFNPYAVIRPDFKPPRL